MELNLRKYAVGLVSFGILAAIFLVYMHFNPTSIPSLKDSAEPNQLLSDLYPGQSAKVGDVNIIAFEKPVFMDRDESGRVVRKWGFEELWSRGGNVLEVSQPFMNLYLDDLTCDITADNGRLRQEAGHRGQFPKDIEFTGNVIIHIIPDPNIFDEEIHIYLDDISFISEDSIFSTTGPIKVVSDTVKLEGRGVEFVYSELAQRIQYFKLTDLHELRIKAPEDSLFPDSNDLPASDPNRLETVASSPAPDLSQENQAPQAQYYECILRQNVTLCSPKQLIFSREHVTLTDILFSNSWGDPNNTPETDKPPTAATAVDDPNAGELPVTKFLDIVITCDKGISLFPQNSPWKEDGVDLPPEQTSFVAQDPNVAKKLGHAGFVSQAIVHNLKKRDTHAEGPLELTFCADDVNAPTPQQRLVPIKVTAQEHGTYEAQANRIVVEGDCLCTLLREDPNVIDSYSLEAQTIGIDLAENKDSQTIASVDDIRHMEAYGGIVKLAIYTLARPDANEPRPVIEPQHRELLAGADLECQRFECDPNSGQEVFTATGPGEIRFNNAKAQGTGEGGAAEKACYAFLEGFETLQFFVAENRIVALASENRMQFEYFPIVKGQTTQRKIYAEAKYVEIELLKTHGGKLELGRLTAMGDVYYEDGGQDQDEKQLFTADGVSYDHRLASLRMWSDMDEPCMVNGMSVPGIQYNLRTNDLQTELLGPVIIPLP
jgi:hypothetical protein